MLQESCLEVMRSLDIALLGGLVHLNVNLNNRGRDGELHSSFYHNKNQKF